MRDRYDLRRDSVSPRKDRCERKEEVSEANPPFTSSYSESEHKIAMRRQKGKVRAKHARDRK